MGTTLEFETVVRRRNQLTLPAEVLAELGGQAGDRIVIAIERGSTQATIRLVRSSYSGALRGVYGTSGEVAEYVMNERTAWE